MLNIYIQIILKVIKDIRLFKSTEENVDGYLPQAFGRSYIPWRDSTKQQKSGDQAEKECFFKTSSAYLL